MKAKELRQIIREELKEANQLKEPDFASEKINRTEAAKLAGVSIPTFAKMISNKVFPQHGFGRKKFYLKSEVIEGLKTVTNDKRCKN